MRSWANIEKASNAEIIAWAEEQPWAGPMRLCGQDAGWHAEGDVWTHTLMVYEQVEQLEVYCELPRADQLKLLFTALLHDAGKPATTVLDPETRRTRSPRHSIIGAAMAREVLRELGCPLAMREHIVNLVRYHGRPPFLLEQKEPEHEVIRLSCLLSNKLLYLFALADTRGRKTAEVTRPEDRLHLWRDLSMEHGCFVDAYPFINAHARFLLFRRTLSNLHYAPHEQYRCTVTLMSGLPGAGKDTWLKSHRSELPVVSLDGIREDLKIDATDNQGQVIQAAREQCREHLRAGRDFAFNATNITAQMRQRWVDLFADYEARVEMIYVEPPMATILRQNKERTDAIPESVIHRLLSKIEVPTLAEAHQVSLVGVE
ncbi:putative nucleotidyltransferase with HDIG domain [Prosthecobacter fusiformis]|uniref:Putative nucleotidyltransferase with HDIG domain n=1 Tax=Prosthecobacter fusiformis TaxID=48464 RepID=A0A4R7STC8_9BACT|nr:AAA family ATPase [Prosthecobacter fusiformis]TDU81527.1 putative nucleotidyltransferase with HDIG domain [Prosthecobacter fusiformis]